MNRCLTGFEFVEHFMAKLLRILHDLIEDTVVSRITLSVSEVSVVLTSGHELHAAVFCIRIIDRQPDRDCFGGRQWPVTENMLDGGGGGKDDDRMDTTITNS